MKRIARKNLLSLTDRLGPNDTIQVWAQDMRALIHYVDTLEAALGFYADRRNYPLAINNLRNFKAIVDMGAKAREALDKEK